MQRRSLIKVGVGMGVLLAVAGGTLALVQPARVGGSLTAPARTLLAALARSVLGELWPQEAPQQAQAARVLSGHFEATLAGLSPTQQAEVDELLTIAVSTPGRLALFGLAEAWDEALPEQVSASLQSMRLSRLALRQQAFHAVRDLINAAWFADPAHWAAIGYPGPRALPLLPASTT